MNYRIFKMRLSVYLEEHRESSVSKFNKWLLQINILIERFKRKGLWMEQRAQISISLSPQTQLIITRLIMTQWLMKY